MVEYWRDIFVAWILIIIFVGIPIWAVFFIHACD
jgi:hypothetical protein